MARRELGNLGTNKRRGSVSIILHLYPTIHSEGEPHRIGVEGDTHGEDGVGGSIGNVTPASESREIVK